MRALPPDGVSSNASRRLARHPRDAAWSGSGPKEVRSLVSRAQAALEDRDELVEVGVEEQPALLEHHAREVAERIEPHAADIGGHRLSPFVHVA